MINLIETINKIHRGELKRPSSMKTTCVNDRTMGKDAKYYYDCILSEIAAAGSDQTQLKRIHNEYFTKKLGLQNNELIKYSINKVLKKRSLLCDKFLTVLETLAKMEQIIMDHIDVLARNGASINISMPDNSSLPSMTLGMIYEPVVLVKSFNSIIDYINTMNINSLLREPQPQIPHLVLIIDEEPKLAYAPVDDYEQTLQTYSETETILQDYIGQIEQYQVDVVICLEGILELIKKIINNLH